EDEKSRRNGAGGGEGRRTLEIRKKEEALRFRDPTGRGR
ncbi:uncharacterized, partial [Tachysurus ichikawai]